MERGVVYAATGERFVEEARQSAASLTDQHPDMPVTLFTDRAVDTDCFDDVVVFDDPAYDYLDKIRAVSRTPYDETLFLDTDTYIAGDITPVFDFLERFDIAASYIPGHWSNLEPDWDEQGFDPDIPAVLPEFNTGVIVYRDTDELQDAVDQWTDLYFEYGEMMHDQPGFRLTMYRSDLHLGVLPPEYNCRFPFPGAVMGQVKILHGRHPDMEAMAERMNARQGLRVYTGDAHRRIIAHPKPPVTLNYPGPGRLWHMARRVKEIADEEGWRSALVLAKNRASRLFR